MKLKTIPVYTFAELSDKAKDNARYTFTAQTGYSWADDTLASIKALAEHFDGKVKDYGIDWFNSSYSSMSFDMPEMTKTEIGARLKTLGSYNTKTGRGNGDCNLTGFCADEYAIDGFRKAFKSGETNLGALMQAAFDTWLKAAQADAEYQQSVECFTETCEANGYEFYENGDMA